MVGLPQRRPSPCDILFRQIHKGRTQKISSKILDSSSKYNPKYTKCISDLDGELFIIIIKCISNQYGELFFNK